MNKVALRIAVDDELLELIAKAAKLTSLSESEVIRRSIRFGTREIIRRQGKGKPCMVEYLRDFRGLEIPKRRYAIKHRK